MVRLDKFLADAGIGTRSEVKKYIKQHFITVNAAAADKPEQKIVPGQDVVCFRGEEVVYETYTYLLFHKPSGCVTARTDNSAQTVMELLPNNLGKNLSPVGRLDKDTEGLLLITNDGALNHHLTSPAHHVSKTYYAILDRDVPPEAVQQFASGIDIGDEEPTLPAALTILSGDEPMDAAFSGEGAAHAHLTITEGRYHQVKRMFAAVGCNVIYLKRLSLGTLSLGALARGEYRKLSAAEVAELWS